MSDTRAWAAGTPAGQTPIQAADRLIVALDVPAIEEARAIVRELEGVVSFFKLGPWLSLVRGYEALMDDVIAAGNRVFVDNKGQDIPETMRGGVRGAVERKITFLTIHGNGEVSDAAVQAAITARGTSPLKIMMVTVLTSLDQSDLEAMGYGNKTLAELAMARAQRAMRLGADGIIASGHEAQAIKKAASKLGRPFLVVAPGIRPRTAGSDDHKRAMTPSAAITAGADYLVVGRPIIGASNRAQAARSILDEMQSAFDAAIR